MEETDVPKIFNDILDQLLAIKVDGNVDQAQTKQVIDSGALQILAFRQHHRSVCEATDTLREATTETKTALDQTALHLQNLLYEKQHYEKEITGCHTFKSNYTDEQLELLSPEEFAANPDALSAGLVTDDPHQLMINRLQHELTYRQKTVQELDALKSKRDTLAAEVAQRRSAISDLVQEVAKLKAAATKIQTKYDDKTTTTDS